MSSTSNVPMELRSASWWSEYWQENFVQVEDSDKFNMSGDNTRVQVGRINSRTENTSTRQGFYTSRTSVEEEAERYPFISREEAPVEEEESYEYEEECEEDLFGGDDESEKKEKKEYPWIGSITNNVVSIPRVKSEKSNLIDPLFESKGAIHDATQISYSSHGKSGSANGEFSCTIVGSKGECKFRQSQARERASVVDDFESNVKKFFSTLLNEWWLSAEDSSEKLLVKHSSVERKKRAGGDRYGPTYYEETIQILSIIYESEGKKPVTICTFIKDRSYYG